MSDIYKTQFQLRRGKKEAWERNNPTLASGEPGYSIDQNILKIGDGETPWDKLTACGQGLNTSIKGKSAHAEGELTQALKDWTHTEGFGTIANSNYQHVQGKWNVIDESNKYAHILGGGTSNENRANLHTIDWKGNAWFAGSLEAKSLKIESLILNHYLTVETIWGTLVHTDTITANNLTSSQATIQRLNNGTNTIHMESPAEFEKPIYIKDTVSFNKAAVFYGGKLQFRDNVNIELYQKADIKLQKDNGSNGTARSLRQAFEGIDEKTSIAEYVQQQMEATILGGEW